MADLDPIPSITVLEASPGAQQEPVSSRQSDYSSKSRKGDQSPASRTPQSVRKSKNSGGPWLGMYPTYKTRNKEYQDIFHPGPGDKFLVDYSCAYSKEILYQGRLYLSTVACCFYSSVLFTETKISLRWDEILAISKEKTAFVIPNAIQISTKTSKYVFTTFAQRDSTYSILTRLWQGVVGNQPLSDEESTQLIVCQYPEEEEVDGGVQDRPVVQDLLQEDVHIAPSSGACSQDIEEKVDNWIATTVGTDICDSIVSKSLDQLYDLLFSNSNFYFNFQKDRGTTELDIGNWEEDETKSQSREVAYNMRMKNPVGPKTCQVKETQHMRRESVSGKIYCIDTEAENSGVPYADSFIVKTHICIYAVTSTTARFLVRADIVFKKELWGFLQEKIETNAWNGIRSFYRDLEKSLECYSEDLPSSAKPMGLKRAAEAVVVDQQGKSKLGIAPAGMSPLDQMAKRHCLICSLTIILAVTTMVNLIVLTHLQQLPIGPIVVTTPPPLPPRLKLPQDEGSWRSLLAAQAARHAQLLQHLARSLSYVKENLDQAQKVLSTIEPLVEKAIMDPDWESLILASRAEPVVQQQQHSHQTSQTEEF